MIDAREAGVDHVIHFAKDINSFCLHTLVLHSRHV